MKFSVLLPTRNRLEFLKYAIHSVISQDYDQWEIIVSDNDSEERIFEYVYSLRDERIKYFRTQNFVSVTENWNNALEQSSGDYIIMLGDDDSLRKGYFQKALSLIQKYDHPDLIYTSALLYSYPGVFPNVPEPVLRVWGNASFLIGKKVPFFLKKDEAIRAVKTTLGLKLSFTYNMQFSLISRKTIDKLKIDGSFFHSLYPDYYATTALFLKAERILAVPDPLIIIGICPKSYGYYLYNDQEDKGISFLQRNAHEKIPETVKKYLMPGLDLHTCWFLANETVKRHFGKGLNLKVKRNKYRFLQVLEFFKKFAKDRDYPAKNLWKVVAYLGRWEKCYLPILFLLALCIRFVPSFRYRRALVNRLTVPLTHPQFGMKKIEGTFQNIRDVFENL